MKYEEIVIYILLILFTLCFIVVLIQNYEIKEKEEMLSILNNKRVECLNEIEPYQDLIIQNSSQKVEKIYNPNNLPNGYDLIITNTPQIEVK